MSDSDGTVELGEPMSLEGVPPMPSAPMSFEDEDDYGDLESHPEDSTPFSDSPEWKDITPIPQLDANAPVPVVPIQYSPLYTDVMDYFRAIVAKKEHSERALRLCYEVVDLNAANYMGWWYIRQILMSNWNSQGARNELERMKTIALENPKNFQVWFHRRELLWLVFLPHALNEKEVRDSLPGDLFGHNGDVALPLRLPRPLPMAVVEAIQDEKNLASRALRDDEKNYHVWSYRKWLVEETDYLRGEESFVRSLLEKDPRNNSAWSFKHFLVQGKELGDPCLADGHRVFHFEQPAPEEHAETIGWELSVRNREAQECQEQIRGLPSNESPYNYYSGLYSFRGLRSIARPCPSSPPSVMSRPDVHFRQTVEGMMVLYFALIRDADSFLRCMSKDNRECVQVRSALVELHWRATNLWADLARTLHLSGAASGSEDPSELAGRREVALLYVALRSAENAELEKRREIAELQAEMEAGEEGTGAEPGESLLGLGALTWAEPSQEIAHHAKEIEEGLVRKLGADPGKEIKSMLRKGVICATEHLTKCEQFVKEAAVLDRVRHKYWQLQESQLAGLRQQLAKASSA